jgi:hypothetical protein
LSLELGADNAAVESCAQPDITTVYGWAVMGRVLLLFFAPVLLFGVAVISWVALDRAAVQSALGGNAFEVVVPVVTLAGTILALGYINVRNRRAGLPWRSLGLRRAPVGRSLRYIMGFFVLALLTALSLAAALVALDVPTPTSAAPASSGLTTWIILVAAASVVGPAAEEIIYRGVLFGFLRRRHAFVAAALISSLVFAVTHVSPVVLVTALPLGMFLCLMYERLGSIVPGMILHGLWNLMVALLPLWR